MEYREIRYTVRARIERNEWTVSIHPGGIEGARKVVTGPRERAELLARSMIDRWHERAPRGEDAACAGVPKNVRQPDDVNAGTNQPKHACRQKRTPS